MSMQVVDFILIQTVKIFIDDLLLVLSSNIRSLPNRDVYLSIVCIEITD